MLDYIIGPMGFCPIRPANSTLIRIDYDSGPGDLPRPHGPNDDVNTVIWGVYGQREIEAPYWRGKYPIDEYTLTQMRRMGESGDRPGRIGFQAIRDRVTGARDVTDKRMAQTACQALYGSIPLYYDNAETKVLNYQFSPDLQLDLTAATASDRDDRTAWDNFEDSNPLDDIAEMKFRLQQYGAWDPKYILMGANVERNLVQNEKYKAWVARTVPAGIDVTEFLNLPTAQIVGLTPMRAKGTYPILDRLAEDYTGGTTMALENGSRGTMREITANDSIVAGLSTDPTNPEGQERVQVANTSNDVGPLNGKVLTLSAELTKRYSAGDQIVWNRPYIGWNDVFILPDAAPGEWMQWKVAQSIHASMQSQRYAVIHRLDPPIPGRYEVIFGVDGIPIFLKKNQHAYIKTAAI